MATIYTEYISSGALVLRQRWTIDFSMRNDDTRKFIFPFGAAETAVNVSASHNDNIILEQVLY